MSSVSSIWRIILSGLVLVLPMVNNGGLPGTLAMLNSADVSEGPCLSVTELMHHLYSGVNLVPIITPGTYYAPMGSKAMYRKYAEGLLGRPAANQDELDAMKLLLRCGPLFSTVENTGYPNMETPPRFSQTCVSGGLPSFPNLGLLKGSLNVDYIQAVCLGMPAIRPDGSTAMHASQSFVSTLDSIMWVNESGTALLSYRCPADGLKDYKVVSKNKTLSEHDVSIIVTKITELGFNKANIEFMRYD